jgi:type I restriction enzyme S subunit
MNKAAVALLQKHFDLALDAPDGIRKLRELILTLAMQGKLVPQDPKDQPASELLKEIQAEKRRLVKEGKIKERGRGRERASRGDAEGAEIRPEDVPYAVPAGWEWVRLGEIADYNGRDNARPDDITGKTWVLDLEDIEKGTSRIINRVQYSERNSKSTKSIFCKGDVLYGKLRPYLDKVIVADTDGVCTTEIVPIVPSFGICADFLRWLLKRPAFLEYVNVLSYGVKMPRLGTEDAIQSLHPLPPLAEQKRIVAKIDQLMATCDALEQLRNSRQQMRRDIHTAAIHQILDPSSAPSRSSAPRLRVRDFLFSHFSELYSVKENVAELRKAILQLAVMGMLVPQDPKDQPASELLKEIEAEKRRLVKEGKIKAPKPLPEIKPEDVPYVVPKGWEWVRLGEVGETNIGLTYSPANISDSGIPVLRSSNVKNGKLDFGDIVRVSMDVKESVIVREGDLLICARNGSKALVGKTAMIMGLSEPMAFGAFMAIFRSRLNHYLLRFINSPLFRQLIDEVNTMTINQITQENLRNTLFPLPPLAEQKRIVAKIDMLMSMCDSLEHGIEAASNKQSEVLGAVLAQV